jgi:hypothetical protein
VHHHLLRYEEPVEPAGLQRSADGSLVGGAPAVERVDGPATAPSARRRTHPAIALVAFAFWPRRTEEADDVSTALI